MYQVCKLLVAFAKNTLSQRNSHRARNCIFWYFLDNGYTSLGDNIRLAFRTLYQTISSERCIVISLGKLYF